MHPGEVIHILLRVRFQRTQPLILVTFLVLVGIYHCGIGRYKSEERCVAISIYCDIFEHIDGFCRPDYLYLNRSVSPWFCRHEIANSREELTESFRQKVQEYIDQPWQCLREGVDVLNFAELEGQDLSTVPLPGFEGDETGDTPVDTNWMLVDTPDKMKQCIKELQVSTESLVVHGCEMHRLVCFGDFSNSLRSILNITLCCIT